MPTSGLSSGRFTIVAPSPTVKMEGDLLRSLAALGFAGLLVRWKFKVNCSVWALNWKYCSRA